MKQKAILDKKSFLILGIIFFVGTLFAAGLVLAKVYEITWLVWVMGGLLIATFLALGICAMIFLYHRQKKQSQTLHYLTEQINSSRLGSVPLLTLLREKLGEFSPLQDALNSFLETYSRFEVVYSSSSQDKSLRDQIALGHVFREDEFKKNLYFELQGIHSARCALLMFELVGKQEKEKNALLSAIQRAFPGAMIGNRDNGYACFVYEVGALLTLEKTCKDLVTSFCTLDVELTESVSYCKVGGVIYPFVSMSDLYIEAEKALQESDDVNILSTFDRFYFPRTVLTENNKLVIYTGFLESAELHFATLLSHNERVEFLSSLFQWAASTLGITSGGYLVYDAASKSYRVEMDTSRSGENKTFGKMGGRIEEKYLNPFFEEASKDLFFAVKDTKGMPSEYASFMANLGLTSLYLRALSSNGERLALIFFAGEEKTPFDSIVSHVILDSVSHLVYKSLSEMKGQEKADGSDRIVNALASRTHRYLYSIDRASYRLTFVSSDLQKVYPEARPGALCYNALKRGYDGPCSYCPLARGTTSRLLPELNVSPCTLSVLEYRGADSERSTLLIETEGMDTAAKSSKLVDEALMIHNQAALSLIINRDCKNRNPGYVLSAKVNNIANLKEVLPQSDLTSLIGQIVKNFQDAGYEDVLYRFDDETLSFLLPNYTKTKAISFAEEAAEIFAIPLESGNIAKLPEVSYCLVAYPGDVSNARQFITLVKNDLERSHNFGPGFLVDQSGANARKAKRSEFVSSLLKDAVNRDNMKVFLQPIVDAKSLRPITGDIRAALFAPDKSEIAPGEFIPLAEKDGLVSQIDVSSFHAMGELFSQYGYTTFKSVGVTHLAIYLSLESIMDASFPAQVKKAMNQYHFPKNCVQFEIKMGFINKNGDAVKRLMEELAGQPIEWVASEFNYEHDSLETLQNFNILVLKTDRLIVSNALSSPRDGTSFARFCSDALKGGFRIVATGIETEEQCKFVSHLGVHEMEGYYFGRPMKEEDFLNAIAYGSDPSRK